MSVHCPPSHSLINPNLFISEAEETLNLFFCTKEICCSPFNDEAQTALFKDPSPYRAVNTFVLGYKNQSVYAVIDTSRCLFSDKYRTPKYSVGRAYSC